MRIGTTIKGQQIKGVTCFVFIKETKKRFYGVQMNNLKWIKKTNLISVNT